MLAAAWFLLELPGQTLKLCSDACARCQDFGEVPLTHAHTHTHQFKLTERGVAASAPLRPAGLGQMGWADTRSFDTLLA